MRDVMKILSKIDCTFEENSYLRYLIMKEMFRNEISKNRTIILPSSERIYLDSAINKALVEVANELDIPLVTRNYKEGTILLSDYQRVYKYLPTLQVIIDNTITSEDLRGLMHKARRVEVIGGYQLC